MTDKPMSRKQVGRQRTRKNGRYSLMRPCKGGCGTRLNVEAGDYCSHVLTDRVDAEGVSFGDAALELCDACCEATNHQTTLREFRAFVAARK